MKRMTQSRFEKLQEAIKIYGAAAFENLMRCKGLGEAIVAGFPDYLGCGRNCVTAVPPEGAFDPRKDYGEEAFSFRRREVIALEPVPVWHRANSQKSRRFRCTMAAHRPFDRSDRQWI